MFQFAAWLAPPRRYRTAQVLLQALSCFADSELQGQKLVLQQLPLKVSS